jgi:hypothetical protein
MEKTITPPPGTSPESLTSERWVRPPVGKAVCPVTGLKHAAFYRQFVGNPRIRQARVGTGRERGTRLLWLPDIHRELCRLAEGGEE